MYVSCQLHSPTALSPEKESPIPIRWDAGWAPDPVWTLWKREKCIALAGNGTPAAQSLACRYTGSLIRVGLKRGK
jgi:hypothetical protein